MYSAEYFSVYAREPGLELEFDISCKLPPLETICTRCQILFQEKYFKLSSADSFTKSAKPETAGLGGSVGCVSDWPSGGCGFDPTGSATFLVEIDLQSLSPLP